MAENKNLPVRKVTAAGLGGAVSTILVFVSIQLGAPITPEVAASITTILAFACAYLVPAKKSAPARENDSV